METKQGEDYIRIVTMLVTVMGALFTVGWGFALSKMFKLFPTRDDLGEVKKRLERVEDDIKELLQK